MMKEGDAGAAVGQLHQQLLEAGYSPSSDEVGAQSFGSSTTQAVIAFQAHHAGPDRQALAQDGVVGPATQWALDHPGGGADGYIAKGWQCDPAAARAEVRPAIVAALAEIGNVENPDGSNSGPLIDKYGQRGQAWCAFFLSWCFGQLPGGSPWGRIGSAWGLYQWAMTNGRLLVDVLPMPGDVFFLLRPPNDRGEHHGHAGMVVGVSYDQALISTVEGNSSNAVRGVARARLDLITVQPEAPRGFLRPVSIIS